MNGKLRAIERTVRLEKVKWLEMVDKKVIDILTNSPYSASITFLNNPLKHPILYLAWRYVDWRVK